MGKRELIRILIVFIFLSLIPLGVLSKAEAATIDNFEASEKPIVFTTDQKAYKVGEKLFVTDVAPYIKDLGNGGKKVMVPVAFLAQALGMDSVRWIPEDRVVQITKNKKEIAIFIDKSEISVNGQKMPLDVPPEIKDIGDGGGRVMVSMDNIAKAFNLDYQWNEATRSVYFNSKTKVFNQKGTFGPDRGLENIEGSVIINAEGVTLQNMLIDGDLTLAENVGDGDVALKNIIVKGETYIRGGGKESIHIDGGGYNGIIIQNINGGVRVVVNDATGAEIVVAQEAQGKEIILEGTLTRVVLEAPEAKIIIREQTIIDEVVVTETAKEATIEVAQNTVVNVMIIRANIDVQGQGVINKVVIESNNVTLGITPKELIVVSGVTPPSNNKTSKQPSAERDEDRSNQSSKSNQPAPAGLKGIQPTTLSNQDGKITGVTDAMEYRLKGTSKWFEINGVEITGLVPGTYEVRYKAKIGYYAGEIIEVIVPEYEPPYGPEVDKEVLLKTIETALEKVAKAIIGNEPGNYPESAVESLLEAIAVAQAVVDKDEITQIEIDDVVMALKQALAVFDASILTPPDIFTLIVVSNPIEGGRVTVSDAVYGNGEKTITTSLSFEKGRQLELKAEPNENYEFINWDGEGIENSTENPYKFIMPANNVILTANYELQLIPVSSVSVNGEAVVGKDLTANVAPTGAKVTYQWQRANEENGSFTDIENATGSVYQLTEADRGKWIRVTVTGIEKYTGTVESKAIGPVEPIEEVTVNTLTEIEEAINNPFIKLIHIGNGFQTTKNIVINRTLTINGGGNTLSFTEDLPGWQGNYVLEVCNTQGVIINDLKLTGGDGGLLVKDAKVQLIGNIDVSGNEFGGIEVLKTSEAETAPTLTVTNALLVNYTEAYSLPTIWETGVSGTVEGFKGAKITYKGDGNNQEHYYLDEGNTKSNVTDIKVKENSEIAMEIDNINHTIKIGSGIPIWKFRLAITSIDGSRQSYVVTDSGGMEIKNRDTEILWFFSLKVTAEAGDIQSYKFIVI